MILIYITHENQEEAEKVCDKLLKEKLIKCVNYIPIKSAYWWKEKIENSNEIVSILKTKENNWEKIKSRVKELHPYEVPCIIKINIEANKEYDEWISQ